MNDTQIDGLADRASDASDRDLQAVIRNVLAALPRGLSPEQCQDCGGEIERIRLELLPGTGKCAGCAQRHARIRTFSLN